MEKQAQCLVCLFAPVQSLPLSLARVLVPCVAAIIAHGNAICFLLERVDVGTVESLNFPMACVPGPMACAPGLAAWRARIQTRLCALRLRTTSLVHRSERVCERTRRCVGGLPSRCVRSNAPASVPVRTDSALGGSAPFGGIAHTHEWGAAHPPEVPAPVQSPLDSCPVSRP